MAVLVSLGKPTVPEPGKTDNFDSYLKALKSRDLEGSLGEEEYSADVPAGQISSVSPAPGTEAATGTVVDVHVSKGPRPVQVPGLSQQPLDRAEQILKDAGLKVGKVSEEFDATAKKGTVVRTQPQDGAELPQGSAVDVVISNAIDVPDVTGKTTEEATQLLRDAGLNPKVGSQVTSNKVDLGKVAKQSPSAGEVVDPTKHTTVTIQESKSMSVPIVLGLKGKEAKKTLEDKGLKVDIDGSSNGLVIGQTPSFGSKVEKGDRVKLKTL